MEVMNYFDKIRCYKMNTVIVGTGAAGYNAADQLWEQGQTDVAIVTEHINGGTSRNTGSDKQTYYKLTLGGAGADSVREMAETLFSGQCVDGDLALCEAALSSQCFFKLVSLGVPFPCNRWGEYVGYKTDHDPRRRATSVGPYTSRYMTECLEKAVDKKQIPVFDKMQVIRILSDGKRAYGLLCLDLNKMKDEKDRFVLFQCSNIVYATGGPAGMYADSVYPAGHYGASGVAFEAGVKGKNLTEWQYGLSSIHPRWNVSGTYMQVLPKFYSTNKDGTDKREFLREFFEDPYEMMNKVFLKGYQWPFDVRKLIEGSSIIDILVYIESRKGRRVFLDYRENSCEGEIDFKKLDKEVQEYLSKAEACFGTPIERLKHMNMPAIEFYRDRGVDLEHQPLEIALCAQHNNGGLAVDAWWQTNIEGFFAVGEVSGSHGVYRPGGSALNAGQVGSVRAAQYIAAVRSDIQRDDTEFMRLAVWSLTWAETFIECAVYGRDDSNRLEVRQFLKKESEDMSRFGASIRDIDKIEKLAQMIKVDRENFTEKIKVKDENDLWLVFRLWDILTSQYVYLETMMDYIRHGGRSRGSALYTDKAGQKADERLPEEFKFRLDDGRLGKLIQEVQYKDDILTFQWRPVREIPEEEDFFENVWRTYRENKNIVSFSK